MKVKVILGTVRSDKGEFKVGETLGLPETEAKQLIASGAVEEFKEPTPEEKEATKKVAEKAKKAEEEKAEEKEKKVEVDIPKPSMAWTRKELIEAAEARNIEVPPKAIKAKILELLNSENGGGEKA